MPTLNQFRAACVFTFAAVALGLPRGSLAQEQNENKPEISAQAPAAAEKTEAAESGAKPQISFPQPEHDFGTVWTGDQMEHTFDVRNTGDAPLHILKVKPSCGCTLAGQYDRIIEPGGAGKIPVKVNSKSLHNRFTKTIRVESDDPKERIASLKITGVVNQYVETEPRYLRFGNLRPNEEKTQILTITNNSDRPLTLNVPENFNPDFKAELVEKVPGQKYEVKITSQPPFQRDGRSNAQLIVGTNVPQQPKLRIRTLANILPRIQVQPQQIIIPQASSNETTKRIMITNQLESPVHLLDAKVNDERINLSTRELQPGKRYQVELKIPANYVPDAKGKTLTLKFDDSKTTTETVPIRRSIRRRRQRPAMKLVGQQAPSLEITTHDGKKINTEDPQADVTVLKFYATWCGFCKKSLPEVEKMHQEYKDKGVRFVAVNLDDPNDRNPRKRFTREQSLAKLEDLGVTFEVAFDPNRKVRVPFKVTSFPTMFVLDDSGKVANVYVGAMSGPRIKQLTSDIDSLLSGPDEVTKVSPESKKTSVSGTQ